MKVYLELPNGEKLAEALHSMVREELVVMTSYLKF